MSSQVVFNPSRHQFSPQNSRRNIPAKSTRSIKIPWPTYLLSL